MNMYAENQPQTQFTVAPVNRQPNISEHEASWRSKFPSLIVLILAIVQFIFTIIIFILEIASLAVLILQPTGVGIWSAAPFLTVSILTFILARRKSGSRKWATIVLIAQLVLLVFTFILIGITGNFVQTGGYGSYIGTSYIGPYDYDTDVSNTYVSGSYSAYSTKYHLVQAQLAFAILLMFTGFTYVAIYIIVTFLAVWRPYHTIDAGHIFHD